MANISTTSTAVAQGKVPFQNGNIIYCTDTREILVDTTKWGRTSYKQIITLNREIDRQALASPLNGFYFIKNTSQLWSYDGEWIAISSPQDKQIVFMESEHFPPIGDPEVIYIDDTKMYRYIDGAYVLMNDGGGGGGGTVWVYI